MEWYGWLRNHQLIDSDDFKEGFQPSGFNHAGFRNHPQQIWMQGWNIPKHVDVMMITLGKQFAGGITLRFEDVNYPVNGSFPTQIC